MITDHVSVRYSKRAMRSTKRSLEITIKESKNETFFGLEANFQPQCQRRYSRQRKAFFILVDSQANDESLMMMMRKGAFYCIESNATQPSISGGWDNRVLFSPNCCLLSGLLEP